jgi:hypothetical protein
MLCQVCLGQRDLAAFAADLTDAQMEALGFPRDWSRRGRHYRPPSESSFFRLLSHLPSRELEKSLLAWQDAVLGPRDSRGDQVAVDGKELLNSQGLETPAPTRSRTGAGSAPSWSRRAPMKSPPCRRCSGGRKSKAPW